MLHVDDVIALSAGAALGPAWTGVVYTLLRSIRRARAESIGEPKTWRYLQHHQQPISPFKLADLSTFILKGSTCKGGKMFQLSYFLFLYDLRRYSFSLFCTRVGRQTFLLFTFNQPTPTIHQSYSHPSIHPLQFRCYYRKQHNFNSTSQLLTSLLTSN